MRRVRKSVNLLLSSMALVMGLSSCKGGGDTVYYATNNKVGSDFVGIGVEWGVYEDTAKLRKDYWEVSTSLVDKLNPSIVRCMVSYEWFIETFDDKGNTDINDDTWTYDFDNKYMLNACQILDYCQNHHIDVAFGAWNVIGNPSDDAYGMIKNTTADIRWAKISADVLDYLVNVRGYTCIKWFVSSNEPNYTGVQGTSKNAYNTFDKWALGVRNVRKALDEVGLESVAIVGGDTTGFYGSGEYMVGIADGLLDVIDNYGIHLYIGNFDIDETKMSDYLKQLCDEVSKKDKKLSTEHKLIIWEGGLLDGKNTTTDCNAYIGNYSYGIRMADYTIQSILQGVNGLCYWDLDDAMYFMYTENGTNAKEWGMFSTLATATTLKQEVRPWYHSSTIFANMLRPGNLVYAPSKTSETFRSLATVSSDGSNGGIIAINRDIKAITETFQIEQTITNNEKLYIYIFNEQSVRLDEDGFITPNMVVDGSLNDQVTITIPGSSLVAISSTPLVKGGN